ncbi:MAG TPA: hypothetical protein VMZ53_26785 [Kofleriaceae bacterium]|nr:hypothetical protein [Kofleriaceae bacterium]
MMTRVTCLLLALAGCSFYVDKDITQCDVDSDCESFGNHPYCQEGVCVDSHLGPPGCFFGEPTTQEEFANRCTTSQTFQYDNCAKLGLCDQGALDAAWTTTAAPQSLGTVPPPVNTQPTPTVNCVDVNPNMVYITGSTNLPPLVKAVQPLLYAGNPSYVAVFAPQTSCRGAGSILDPDATKHLIKNVTNNYAFYYDQQGKQTFCLLDPAGTVVDVGESDVNASACGFSAVANTADYVGPVLTIDLVVPSSSSQTTISAEAAHLVFGAGGASGKVTPWTDPHYYFTRSSGTGTTQLVSRAIGVDATMWWGIDRLSAGNLVASMEAIDPTVSESVIGVLSADYADKAKANLRLLAFQQKGQKYAYLPDSTPQVSDKANVRDGHYPIWGAIHFFASTANGVPSQAASAFITQFSVPKLKEELVSAIIDAGFVPSCAMKVSRTVDVGPLSPYTPPFGCGCYFDNKVNGATACKKCTTASDCTSAAPACNYGFCEKQ